MDIISELERKMFNLKREAEYYKKKYFKLLDKFQRFIFKWRIKRKELRELLEDVDFILINIENKFKVLEEIKKEIKELWEMYLSLDKRLCEIERKLAEVERYIKRKKYL